VLACWPRRDLAPLSPPARLPVPRLENSGDPLLFHPTPNPAKVALMLEELGLAYEVIPVDTSKGEQHAPGYRAMGDAVDLNLFD
jgi:hypothetical protein